MIYRNGKEITSLSFGARAIQAVYCGARLVWEAISSCFGGGRWLNVNLWSNADGWRNE